MKLICLFTLVTVLVHANVVTAQIGIELADVDVQEAEAPPWKGSFAAGLNAKSGNSENLDINMTLKLNRESDVSTTDLLASYFYSSNGIATVTDRFFGQARQERKFQRPGWSLFFQTGYEWDRFKAFDYRIALHSGLGYEIYQNDDGFLKTRLGAGASKEFGAPAAEWIPELQIGGDWERQLTDTVKSFVTVDYYPSFENFADYRINTQAGVEFDLDAARNINFRMFALDRYDSTPVPGNQANDIDYGMAISIGF